MGRGSCRLDGRFILLYNIKRSEVESVCKLYRALIADDERAELEGLSSLIQKAGLPFCVTLCSDGAKAYAALQEEHFDLLFPIS